MARSVLDSQIKSHLVCVFHVSRMMHNSFFQKSGGECRPRNSEHTSTDAQVGLFECVPKFQIKIAATTDTTLIATNGIVVNCAHRRLSSVSCEQRRALPKPGKGRPYRGCGGGAHEGDSARGRIQPAALTYCAARLARLHRRPAQNSFTAALRGGAPLSCARARRAGGRSCSCLCGRTRCTGTT